MNREQSAGGSSQKIDPFKKGPHRQGRADPCERFKPGPDPLLVNLGLTSQIGLTMVAAVFIGLFLGHKLDELTGGGYLWKVLGIPLGIASGFWAVYKIIDSVLKCDLD